MATYKIVLVRHGESEWNKLNKFCGWYDAELSDLGVQEAKKAGQVLFLVETLSHLVSNYSVNDHQNVRFCCY